MPLAIDLFCGLGGWTEGLLAEGYHVIGFDIEQHQYGDHRYPAQLVVQDVLTQSADGSDPANGEGDLFMELGSFPGGGVDLDGRPLVRQEDWQQGIAVIEYMPGDGPFAYEQIAIHDGWARWRGKEYTA